jgi:hypothetical protein
MDFSPQGKQIVGWTGRWRRCSNLRSPERRARAGLKPPHSKRWRVGGKASAFAKRLEAARLPPLLDGKSRLPFQGFETSGEIIPVIRRGESQNGRRVRNFFPVKIHLTRPDAIATLWL